MRWFARNDLKGRGRVIFWAGFAVVLIAVFILDVFTPRGFESDDFDLPLILLVALFGKPRQVLIVAVAMTVLDIAGYFPSPGGIATGWAIGNRALGIFTIWLTASLVLFTRNLWAANSELQIEIAQRERAENDLKKALAVKDDFLGMVSHEMRTPLTAVIGIASLLDAPDVETAEGDRAELMIELRASAQRLAATIENMLALARVEAGRKTEFADIYLRELVNEQVAQHLKRHAEREIRVRQDDGLPQVTASADLVRHILANLIENAEKYSPQEKPIDVELRREGNEVTTRVLDHGVGLSGDEAEHVFEPFYRSPRLARGSSGMGIGLSVCRRLVEEQNGRIWALPRQGGGSEFGFSLPMATASINGSCGTGGATSGASSTLGTAGQSGPPVVDGASSR
jgi:signal transduction histidine kinase